MSVKSKMMGVGFAAAQADQLAGAGATGLVATGSSATDALLISSHLNAVATTASSTGVVLSTSFTPGDEVYVFNGGANTLAIYPPSGATMDNTTSATIVTLKGIRLVCAATNIWVSHKST